MAKNPRQNAPSAHKISAVDIRWRNKRLDAKSRLAPDQSKEELRWPLAIACLQALRVAHGRVSTSCNDVLSTVMRTEYGNEENKEIEDKST